MPQEQTAETMAPETELKGGKVRPRSKAKVVFLNSKFHATPFFVEEIHPALAEKLLAEGKIRMGGKLTEEEKADNKKSIEAKVKSKGRTPGKKKVEDEDFDDDLIDDNKGKEGKDKDKSKP